MGEVSHGHWEPVAQAVEAPSAMDGTWPSADASKGFFRFRRCLGQLRLQSTCYCTLVSTLAARAATRAASREATHSTHGRTDTPETRADRNYLIS
jgi:hypothetical protein